MLLLKSYVCIVIINLQSFFRIKCIVDHLPVHVSKALSRTLGTKITDKKIQFVDGGIIEKNYSDTYLGL